MKIGGLQKFSLIDYPKKISAIVFTQGCNFKCPYCHNPELVCNGIFDESILEEEILDFLKTRIGKLDAISITGGEPTLQSDLVSFCEKVKEMGFLIKLDTNGTNAQVVKELISKKLVDYIAMDLKAPLDKYSEVVRAKIDIDEIIKSVEMIKKSGIDHEFRTTLVQLLLTEDDVLQMKKDFGPMKRYILQKFIPSKTLDETFLGASCFTPEVLDRLSFSFEDCSDFLIR